jgi:hypothetical protein
MFHRVNLLKLLAYVLLCQLAGAVGSAMASSLGNGIFENRLSTPLWVFFPVWITSYAYGDFPLPCLGKRAGTTGNQNGTGYLRHSVRP